MSDTRRLPRRWHGIYCGGVGFEPDTVVLVAPANTSTGSIGVGIYELAAGGLRPPVWQRSAQKTAAPIDNGRRQPRPSFRCTMFVSRKATRIWVYERPPAQLLLPPSTQRLVKLNERQALVQLGLHQVEFRREVIRFAGENLEITGATILVEDLGQLIGPLRRAGE